MASITQYSAFDPSKLSFGKFRQNTSGKGGSVPYTYGDQPVLRIQTPVGMRLPFGISTYPDSDPPKKTIDFDLDGHDEFRAVIEAVEAAARAHAVANGKELFNNDNREELQMFVKFNSRSSIKKGKGQYSDTFKAAIDYKNGEDKIGIWVGNTERSTMGSCADVCNNSTATGIIELRSFWIVDGKMGCKWTCPQLKVYSTNKKLHESDMMINDGSIMTVPDDVPPAKRRKIEEDENEEGELDALSDEEA